MAVRSDVLQSALLFPGEKKVLEFTITQSDGVTAQDITGWTFAFELFPDSKKRSRPIFSKDSGAGIAITVAASGELEVTIDEADTLGLVPRKYWYRLRRTNAAQGAHVAFGDFWLN